MHIPDDYRKSVAFLGVQGKSGFEPRATAFFVGVQDFPHSARYLVTAQHNVQRAYEQGRSLWIRCNSASGGAWEEELPIKDWRFHPDNASTATDVAVCDFGRVRHDEDIVYLPIAGPYSMLATPEKMQAEALGLGDEVAVIGLFSSHHGQRRNIPIVRTGNICSLFEEPIETKFCGPLEALLIEARSIGGLSGSPVFVVAPPFRISNGKPHAAAGPTLYLLGLMHGHFEIPAGLGDDTEDKVDFRALNAGIGIVIPANKILETVNHPDLLSSRKEEWKQSGHHERVSRMFGLPPLAG